MVFEQSEHVHYNKFIAKRFEANDCCTNSPWDFNAFVCKNPRIVWRFKRMLPYNKSTTRSAGNIRVTLNSFTLSSAPLEKFVLLSTITLSQFYTAKECVSLYFNNTLFATLEKFVCLDPVSEMKFEDRHKVLERYFERHLGVGKWVRVSSSNLVRGR